MSYSPFVRIKPRQGSDWLSLLEGFVVPSTADGCADVGSEVPVGAAGVDQNEDEGGGVEDWAATELAPSDKDEEGAEDWDARHRPEGRATGFCVAYKGLAKGGYVEVEGAEDAAEAVDEIRYHGWA